MSFKIVEYEVSGMDMALRASGLPLSIDKEPVASLKRGKVLGSAKGASGHDCFLKGINVTMVIDAPLKWFDQFDRYAFQDTVSSTSQMHRLLDIDLEKSFPETVDARILDILLELKDDFVEDPNNYNKYRKLLDSVPQSFLYRRCITTNYLQLKTMYFQRKNHKLHEWKDFCDWMLTELPNFEYFISK